jgi:hypothetical protein
MNCPTCGQKQHLNVTDERRNIIRINAIRLVEHHKQHCDGADCNISISCIGELLTLAGIPLTDAEYSNFL